MPKARLTFMPFLDRLAASLKIRPGEGRLATLLIALMLCVSVGSGIGGTGMDALFYSRFGIQPYLYVILGLVTFFNLMAVTSLLQRVARERLYVVLPLALAAVLVAEWFLVSLHLAWFYPVMWLSKEVLNSLAGLFSWGLAAAVCDTRQAKRLFPLFTAGSILGTLLGSFGTPPLVAWLHSENLLLVWALGLFLTFLLSAQLARSGRARAGAAAPASTTKPARARETRKRPVRAAGGIFHEIQQGFQYVRASPLMRWISLTAVLFSVLWFALLLPFTRAAAGQYPTADSLTNFFALFQGLYTALALAASLFFANRLFARFGLMNMLIVYPAIYLFGFIALIIAPFFSTIFHFSFVIFPILVAFRFGQLIWSQGIADTIWQAIFNVVPAGRRDQTWAFVNGVPGQVGIIIAGLLLMIGEQTLAPAQLYWMGLGAAGLTVFVLWQAKRAYGGALADALRAGQPQVFFTDDEPFGGFQRDASALAATVNGLVDPDPTVRHVAVEILGHFAAPQAAEALLDTLTDPAPQVRAASLRALTRAGAARALLEIAACLRDPEAEVRLQAVAALGQLAASTRGLIAHIQPLLADPDPAVRGRSAVMLLRAENKIAGDEARRAAFDLIKTMARDSDVECRLSALTAFGDFGASVGDEASHLTADALRDLAPAVRAAAALALVKCDSDSAHALDHLIPALADDNRSVREAVARALGVMGVPALERTVQALADSSRSTGALLALERLPARRVAPALREYAGRQVTRALHYLALARGLEYGLTNVRLELLYESLYVKARSHGANALRVVGLLGNNETVTLALENLKSRDATQRANALETLEAVGEAALVKPLLKVWETAEGESAPASLSPAEMLNRLLSDEDAWLRACAVFAAPTAGDLAPLAESDPDALVRETAGLIVKGESAMDTLATLPLMERILFLRRVALFTELPPSDLKQVAAIASESFFADGEALAVEGESGDEMYIIVSGAVRVLVGERETEVARRNPGDVVGEMAIIGREPRTASLIAAGAVRALCLGQKQFESLLRERPEISLAVMRVLCERLKSATARVGSK